MGIPEFFVWLRKKYPCIVAQCVEEKPQIIDGVQSPMDSPPANPNNLEFDNFYLDLNAIIHPCCYPANKPLSRNEDEIMIAIFEYIDMLFSIVRPGRLLYIAIDGVVPRAKMNLQRSNKFRGSKKSVDKAREISRIRREQQSKGTAVPPKKPSQEHFDNILVAPGTPFMARLAKCLDYYIHDRLNNDPGWKNIQVILSDSNVPGEGEHKIMDYIRRQRASPDHDPNTRHCLYGRDADLIMLGLATHEPHFTIIREEFKLTQPKPCDLCGQMCHADLEKHTEQDIEFIFIRVNVLREYLEKELRVHDLPYPFDLERAIDDWVFMCFLLGNDFLPHLPSLEIRKGAVDVLVDLYKKTVYRDGGFLTDSGRVDLKRLQLIMTDLGEFEEQVFKTRRTARQRHKQRKTTIKLMNDQPTWIADGQLSPSPVGVTSSPALKARHEEEEEPEDGWKERYYAVNFDVPRDNIAFRHQVAAAYVEGLCWLLRYYYQGCASWKWYFPYHYAPFASDFANIGDLQVEFERGTQPLKPLEQLMAVLPAACSKHVPEAWARLMTDPTSPIIEFYPEDFKIDLNGKQCARQGVALLPFIEEKRLLEALRQYPKLTEEEKKRNIHGHDRLYVRRGHRGYENLILLCKTNGWGQKFYIRPELFSGASGLMLVTNDGGNTDATVRSPIEGLPHISKSAAISVTFLNQEYSDDFLFPAVRLPNAVDPPKVLMPVTINRHQRTSKGKTATPTQRAFSSNPRHRTLERSADISQYGSPNSYSKNRGISYGEPLAHLFSTLSLETGSSCTSSQRSYLQNRSQDHMVPWQERQAMIRRGSYRGQRSQFRGFIRNSRGFSVNANHSSRSLSQFQDTNRRNHHISHDGVEISKNCIENYSTGSQERQTMIHRDSYSGQHTQFRGFSRSSRGFSANANHSSRSRSHFEDNRRENRHIGHKGISNCIENYSTGSRSPRNSNLIYIIDGPWFGGDPDPRLSVRSGIVDDEQALHPEFGLHANGMASSSSRRESCPSSSYLLSRRC